jgi:caffeoyl-CoA O-methyltransferase
VRDPDHDPALAGLAGRDAAGHRRVVSGGFRDRTRRAEDRDERPDDEEARKQAAHGRILVQARAAGSSVHNLPMKPLVAEDIERYAEAHSEPAGPLFEELRDETYGSVADPQMQVGRVEGTLLKMLVELTGAKHALEIGMFTGYSGLMIAAGLPEDGELVTCDVNPKAEEVARRYFARSPHGRKITIRMGPALETIASLPATPTLDFVFLDADKVNYPSYYDAVLPRMSPGGLLVADNVLWSGRVLDPKEESDRAIVAFNARVAGDSRVEKVLLTVRDGILLVRKRG